MQADNNELKAFPAGKVDESMKAYFNKNGFLVLENFLSSEQCDEAISSINKLVDDYELTENNLTVFSTTSHPQRKSKYFRDSADTISFFFENEAIKDGQLVVPKINSINKIGHALHEKHPLFADITFSPVVQEICKFMGYEDPVIPQSMAILKPPKIGGEVVPHQDSTFLYNEPESLLAFWIPLEDATKDNGCLWAIPGSHKWPLYRRYKRDSTKDEEYFEDILPISDWKTEDFVPVEMKKGSLIIFPGHLVHMSYANKSDKSRFAYTFHLFDGAKSKWSHENWLQREQFPKFEKKYMNVYESKSI